jgi:hypothetical protein
MGLEKLIFQRISGESRPNCKAAVQGGKPCKPPPDVYENGGDGRSQEMEAHGNFVRDVKDGGFSLGNRETKREICIIYRVSTVLKYILLYNDRLCGLVVRVPGYRSRDPGSISGATDCSAICNYYLKQRYPIFFIYLPPDVI